MWKYYDFAHAINCIPKLTCMFACACICDCMCLIVHLISNAKKPKLMQKTFGNVFLGHLGGCFFSYFPKVAPDHKGRGRGAPQSYSEFFGSCYNIQFKPCATSKMELFVTENR